LSSTSTVTVIFSAPIVRVKVWAERLSRGKRTGGRLRTILRSPAFSSIVNGAGAPRFSSCEGASALGGQLTRGLRASGVLYVPFS